MAPPLRARSDRWIAPHKCAFWSSQKNAFIVHQECETEPRFVVMRCGEGDTSYVKMINLVRCHPTSLCTMGRKTRNDM